MFIVTGEYFERVKPFPRKSLKTSLEILRFKPCWDSFSNCPIAKFISCSCQTKNTACLCMVSQHFFFKIIHLFTLYVLFSEYRPCDVLQGICLLSFHVLCIHRQWRGCTCVRRNLKKKMFSGVASLGLKWENKTYKLKMSLHSHIVKLLPTSNPVTHS